MPSDAPTLPSLSDRIALHLLQLGAIAVVIAAVTFKQFELDRFFVPKELVLHLTAVLASVCCLARARELPPIGGWPAAPSRSHYLGQRASGPAARWLARGSAISSSMRS
jgi:hypothetical protein